MVEQTEKYLDKEGLQKAFSLINSTYANKGDVNQWSTRIALIEDKLKSMETSVAVYKISLCKNVNGEYVFENDDAKKDCISKMSSFFENTSKSTFNIHEHNFNIKLKNLYNSTDPKGREMEITSPVFSFIKETSTSSAFEIYLNLGFDRVVMGLTDSGDIYVNRMILDGGTYKS